MKKCFLFLTLLTLTIFSFTGCGTSHKNIKDIKVQETKTPQEIIGTWRLRDNDFNIIVYSDGTVYKNHYATGKNGGRMERNICL